MLLCIPTHPIKAFARSPHPILFVFSPLPQGRAPPAWQNKRSCVYLAPRRSLPPRPPLQTGEELGDRSFYRVLSPLLGAAGSGRGVVQRHAALPFQES